MAEITKAVVRACTGYHNKRVSPDNNTCSYTTSVAFFLSFLSLLLMMMMMMMMKMMMMMMTTMMMVMTLVAVLALVSSCARSIKSLLLICVSGTITKLCLQKCKPGLLSWCCPLSDAHKTVNMNLAVETG